jgi:hypothetical protein
MTPEDVRLVVARGDEFSVVCRSLWPLPNGGPPACRGLRMRSAMRPPSKVVDGTVEVVSEGHWKLFTCSAVATESGY